MCSSYDSGSMDAAMAPFDLRISLSAPKAWIWSLFNSACSRDVVRTITFPFLSTSVAILIPVRGG